MVNTILFLSISISVVLIALWIIFRKKIRSRYKILINFFLSIFAVLIVSCFSIKYLDVLTKHNEVISVPNLIGIHIDDAKSILLENGLNDTIIETVYSDDYPMGSVIRQDPKANTETFPSYVKPNRTIYLSIVNPNPEYKIIPDLVDEKSYGKDLGKAELQSLGFVVDFQITEHKDKDRVLEILKEEDTLRAGDTVLKGSLLTLVYGSGQKGKGVELPNLKGETIEFAFQYLNEIGLELEITYDSVLNLSDSNNAIIFKQYPDPENEQNPIIYFGDVINVNASLYPPLDSTIEFNLDLDTTNFEMPNE